MNELLAAAVSAQKARDISPAAIAASFRAIADRYPTNIAVVAQTIQSQLQAGDANAALELARRVAKANPSGADPQRLLTEVYARIGDWTHAEQSALLWRQRSMDHPLNADMALARIYLRGYRRKILPPSFAYWLPMLPPVRHRKIPWQ